MHKAGIREIDAIAKVIRSGKLFRYHDESQCARFESRYARYLSVKHAKMSSSGTAALVACLGGLGIGPGDEVIVPAHTYMATAIAVLAVGAIPVIVDVDSSITLDPRALEDAVGPRTRAVIPVHMWGLVCDMRSIMKVARKRHLLVIEDACQCVGGGYEGEKAGSIGHAGAFSFNYYKNMTCGEGGAMVTSDPQVFQRASCMIDCCSFFWSGKKSDMQPFASNGSRASEIEGAMMNAQLDQIDGIIRTLRRQKKAILAGTRQSGLVASPCHSLDYECGTHVLFTLPSANQTEQFKAQMGMGTILSQTGRHTYNFWEPILNKRGAHHPAMDPFKMPQNRRCRMKYSANMLPRSLDILGRTVMITTRLDRDAAQTRQLIVKINTVAKQVLNPASCKCS